MRAPAISVENVSKVHRIGRPSSLAGWLLGRSSSTSEHWALRDVSVDVGEGSVLGIVGKNGAGKSTLLKILSRITEPTAGQIVIRGRVASLLEVGTGFHPELTGRENVFLNGVFLGMTREQVRRRFDEIVAFSEVEDFLDTPVKRYSSGMYVRLAFAVAAHLDSDVLLVDEVLAVGDHAFQRKCISKMNEVHQGGRTIVLVSHSTQPILDLCTNVLWIDGGRVAAHGPPLEIVSRYLSREQTALGEVRFAPVDRDVRLIRAWTSDVLGGAPCAHISNDKPVCLGIELNVEKPVPALRVGIRLHNERGIAILHTATSDVSASVVDVEKPGKHAVGFQIPGAWLAPGRYHVEIGTWSPSTGHLQHIDAAFGFEVGTEGVESVGAEVLRPALPWRALP